VLILFAKRRKISLALLLGILPTVIEQLNAASKGLGHLKSPRDILKKLK
jgi:hypothetical protein